MLYLRSDPRGAGSKRRRAGSADSTKTSLLARQMLSLFEIVFTRAKERCNRDLGHLFVPVCFLPTDHFIIIEPWRLLFNRNLLQDMETAGNNNINDIIHQFALLDILKFYPTSNGLWSCVSNEYQSPSFILLCVTNLGKLSVC